MTTRADALFLSPRSIPLEYRRKEAPVTRLRSSWSWASSPAPSEILALKNNKIHEEPGNGRAEALFGPSSQGGLAGGPMNASA